jgi:hypothetical protein
MRPTGVNFDEGVKPMRKEAIAAAALLIVGAAALALLPATSLGGKQRELVAKDTDKGDSAVAVATGVASKPGKLVAKVTSKPNHKVAFAYTTDCYEGGKTFQYPPPGQSKDVDLKTPFTKRLKLGGAKAPDFCNVAASAKLDWKAAKKVTVKIFDK